MNRRDFLARAAVLLGIAAFPVAEWVPSNRWVELVWSEPMPVAFTDRVVQYLMGLRSDGNWYYVAVPHWSMDDAIRLGAQERENAMHTLDTFLECACGPSSQCPFHQSMFGPMETEDGDQS